MPEARLRISLETGDLEVEGSEAFVSQYDAQFQELITRLKEQGPSRKTRKTKDEAPSDNGEDDEVTPDPAAGAAGAGVLREFGEILHTLPPKITATEQILVAGWYVQQGSSDATFSTGEANKLLISQGIKVTNAAQCMKQNQTARRIFKVRGNRWRISKPAGEDHLRSLGVL